MAWEKSGRTQGIQPTVLRRKAVQIELTIAVAGSLTRHFLGRIHRRDLDGFDRWLAKASDCDVPEMRRFATYFPQVGRRICAQFPGCGTAV